ncbi:MAG: IMS domain-containing protein [Trichodesmium sp. MAG_R01]|nr:IMS domain-containing protein [Trichodesmium sp. MAG_R01]
MQDTLKVNSKQDKRYSTIEVLQKESFETISLVEDNYQCHKHYLKKELKVRGLKKFQRKLETFVRLEHPQIENIKDFYFDSDQQQLSIIQTYVRGTSYQELLENNTFLSEYEAVQLMNQALKVLSYLHKKGFSHGNICPKNLLKAEDESLILVNFKLIQDIRETAKNEFFKYSKQKNSSYHTNLEEKIEPIEEVDLNQYQDIRDLAITVLMLIGLKREKLLRKNNNTWKWCGKKQISDARTAVFEQILSSHSNSPGISAESIYQSLNTVLPISSSSTLSSLIGVVTGTLGILLIFTALATFVIDIDDSSNNPISKPTYLEPQDFRESTKTQKTFSCPQGELIAIACDVEMNDLDSPNFDGGELTIKIIKGGTENDRLFIYTEKSNTKAGEENSNQVTYQNISIGSFSGGIGTQPLKVVFNSNATIQAVETTVKNIVYQNISDNPKNGTRTLEIKITDGDGDNKSSNTLNRIVNVTSINQPPVLTIPENQTAKEDKKLNIKGISVKDPDGDNICLKLSADNGTIIVNENVSNGASFRKIKYNSDNTVTFCGTPSQVNNTLKANNGIVYASNANFFGSDRLKIFVQDFGKEYFINEQEFVWPIGALKSKTDIKNLEITVEPVNDAPILRGFSIVDSSILTSETALKVIRSWLEIKGEVLGRYRDRQLLSKYTTGAYYEKTQRTINWLSRNQAYYTYEKPVVELVGNFQLLAKQATIDVGVYESPTLYIDGVIDESASRDGKKTYRFTLEFNNGKWKIANVTGLD